MSDWEIVESCLFGYSGRGPIPDARGALSRLRAREQELEQRIHRQRVELADLNSLNVGDSHYVGRKKAEARVQELERERQRPGPYVAPWTYKAAVDDAERAEARVQELEAALREIAGQQQKVLAYIEANGFVFSDIGKEPGNWQHLAFSIYNDICEVDVWARNALDVPFGVALEPRAEA